MTFPMRTPIAIVAALLLGCASQPPLPPLAPAGPPVSAEAPVVVYGTTSCRYTRMALDWFAAHRVPTRFRNVETDLATYDEMINRMTAARVGGQGVPVLDVRGRVLVGFSADEVERALRD